MKNPLIEMKATIDKDIPIVNIPNLVCFGIAKTQNQKPLTSAGLFFKGRIIIKLTYLIKKYKNQILFVELQLVIYLCITLNVTPRFFLFLQNHLCKAGIAFQSIQWLIIPVCVRNHLKNQDD